MELKRNKVLHARVSKDLYEEISKKAKKHRVTVSNLIRNVVEDYLEIQGDVLDVVDDKIKRYLDKDIQTVGYQQITLTKRTICQRCREGLKKGAQAYIGFSGDSSRSILICGECRRHEK